MVEVLSPFVRCFNYDWMFFVWLNLSGSRGGARVDLYLFPAASGNGILNHTLMLQFKSYNKVLMKLKLAAVAIVGGGGLIYLT